MMQVTAEDVVELYSGLLARGVQLWVDGGWGIDALLGRQTRPHKDFDAMVAFENLPALTRFLSGRGFALKVIWPENRWALCPEPPALIGRERPAVEAATAFVLNDDSGRELDFHVVRFNEHGLGMPAWNSDVIFPPDAFAGEGIVGGTRVRCLSAEVQMSTHTGYALQESDLHDLRLLHDWFGIDYPDEVAGLFSAG
jgi:lincosamide nucleotidyltransferase A/C/D/E